MKLLGHGCRAVLLAVAVLLGAASAAARDTTISALVRNPAQFDGQTVTLRGTVTTLKGTVSRHGNEYTTFKLDGPTGGTVSVFKWGHLSLKNGDWVEVEGIFRRAKHVGAYTFYDEIEAENVWVRVVKRVPVDPTQLPSDLDSRP